MNDISNKYFDWLCSLIEEGSPEPVSNYKKLLIFLHDVNFRYTIPLDGNRYEDGIYMRYLYGVASGTSQRLIARELDGKPCSMLEMMIALAAGCEKDIMSNPDYGDRTGVWFWYMVDSLELTAMTNSCFDEKYCWYVIKRFLNREYQPDGTGGLFKIDFSNSNCHFVDLRNYEIWQQAIWYLHEVLEGGTK